MTAFLFLVGLGLFFLGFIFIKKEEGWAGIGMILLGFSFMFFGVQSCDGESQDEGDGYNVPFKGAQTGYTGKCKKCDCPAYDGSSDGICSCEHYKTDHTWHN